MFSVSSLFGILQFILLAEKYFEFQVYSCCKHETGNTCFLFVLNNRENHALETVD